ncbi:MULTISPECIES: ABC transporter ATP-binding protein [unclassified Sutcliffiella]|uniref:ABC transporter ATP-binding protein n=1 Tax=unclassified Sutcliffiella TaxID=2837532 RepID=UPI0030CF7751
MTVVRMKNIVKRYGSQLVLDNIDLNLAEGEIVGLLGPNGAGKTTLIHVLSGIIGFDSGNVHVFGKEQSSNLLDIKREIGLVTQEISLITDLSARENLEFFGGIYGLKGKELKERVDETLEFVGLKEHARKLPVKFSGGMQRRLNIACALVHRPKFLIMDEPTVGIDPQSRNHILETIRKLNGQGTTILYSTHYMEEVQNLASRVVIMDQGHVIAVGTIKELVKRIQHEEKIKMVVANPTDLLLERLHKLDGIKKVTRNHKEITVISQVGAGNLDRALSIAKDFGGILSVTAEEPTLEDVFLTLTGKSLRDGGEE